MSILCLLIFLPFLGKKNGQLKSNVPSNQVSFTKKKSNDANLLVEPSASGKLFSLNLCSCLLEFDF